jgi:hypothetical protein
MLARVLLLTLRSVQGKVALGSGLSDIQESMLVEIDGRLQISGSFCAGLFAFFSHCSCVGDV